MLYNEHRVKNPLENYVGRTLELTFPSASIVYEHGLFSTVGGAFVPDWTFNLYGESYPTVLIEVTEAGMFDIDPKENQRKLMKHFVESNPGYAYAVLVLQNLLDVGSTRVSHGVLQALACAQIDSGYGESILTNYALQCPIGVEDKNIIKQNVNWDEQYILFLNSY